MKEKIAFFKEHPGQFFNTWTKIYNQPEDCEEAFEQFRKNDAKFLKKHPDLRKEIKEIKLNMSF